MIDPTGREVNFDSYLVQPEPSAKGAKLPKLALTLVLASAKQICPELEYSCEYQKQIRICELEKEVSKYWLYVWDDTHETIMKNFNSEESWEDALSKLTEWLSAKVSEQQKPFKALTFNKEVASRYGYSEPRISPEAEFYGDFVTLSEAEAEPAPKGWDEVES